MESINPLHKGIHVLPPPVLPAQAAFAPPYFFQLASSGKSSGRPPHPALGRDRSNRQSARHRRRNASPRPSPRAASSPAPPSRPGPATGVSRTSHQFRTRSRDVVRGDRRPRAWYLARYGLNQACSSSPRLCASSIANASGIVIRLRRLPHRAGQVFRPRLDGGRINRVARRADLEQDRVEFEFSRSIQERDQFRFLPVSSEPVCRRPVDVGHRRDPDTPVFSGYAGGSHSGINVVG